MIGFEISVNGDKLYTVGASDPGDVCVFVSRYRKPHEKTQTLDVHASGANLLSPAGIEHLDWAHQALAVGDEITVRVVEIDAPTPRSVRSRPILSSAQSAGGSTTRI